MDGIENIMIKELYIECQWGSDKCITSVKPIPLTRDRRALFRLSADYL